jgi:hypothetical protein
MDEIVNPHNLKNGDYIKITNNKSISYIYIFREIRDGNIYRHAAYSSYSKDISVNPNQYWSIKNDTKITYATEEEKRLLDNALLEKCYRWNSLTKQLESIGVVDLGINDLSVLQPIHLSSSFYDSILGINNMPTGTISCTKEEPQTETELNLFPKKKHYQLNFNY